MGHLSGRLGALQCNVGHVDRCDLPASASQPHGVGSFAAAHVEGRTWFEVAHFGNEGGVGFTAPHLFGTSVPFVPFCVTLVSSSGTRFLVTPGCVTVGFWMSA
jgi:hypothetical protein